jgi:peptide/nickel transport system permease protein
MTTATANEAVPAKGKGLLRRSNSPWMNGKFIIGTIVIVFMFSLEFIGPLVWDTDMARAASAPINMPPFWVTGDLGPGFNPPSMAHPLGTESSGRDMLALILVATPRSLRVGFIAGIIGMGVGIILGFTAGFLGGRFDAVIRVLSDSFITIPALAVLVVIASIVNQIDLQTMSLLLALFAWPRPTRYVRAQVLSMREQGYVQMAQLSGASSFDIMFKEMMPNLLPYLAAAFIGTVSAIILAATSLEALGLGPTRIPTLGMIIFFAINSAAILRGMWWWWGFPILMLIIIFIALFLMNIGLDEIANPRLRGVQSK